MSLMICSSAVLKCWHIVLVIGEITLHFTIFQSLNRLARKNLTILSFPVSEGKLILVKISKLCHKMPLNIMNALVECEARGRDCKKLRSHSRSCSTRHSLNICLPPDKYMTTRNVSLESTDSTNPEMFNLCVSEHIRQNYCFVLQ